MANERLFYDWAKESNIQRNVFPINRTYFCFMMMMNGSIAIVFGGASGLIVYPEEVETMVNEVKARFNPEYFMLQKKISGQKKKLKRSKDIERNLTMKGLR